MWRHLCLDERYAAPTGRNVQTYERRVDQFVRAILPYANHDEVEHAKGEVYRIFGKPEADDAVARGSTNQHEPTPRV
jgi:hypothetical protein